MTQVVLMCSECGGLMAGLYSEKDKPKMHCLNQHCPEYGKLKPMPKRETPDARRFSRDLPA